MQRFALLVGFLVAGVTAAAAQAPPADEITLEVAGRVVDSRGRPIAGASITVEGRSESAKCDRSGVFRLRAPHGAALVVESDRHGTALITVESELLGDVVLIDESTEVIDVAGSAPAQSPGATKLGRDELQRIPGTGGDLVRGLSALPGIVNGPTPIGYNGVLIRGSSPQDSKILVDDFEIPILFHNLGSSIIPAESIESIELVPGGFDVEHGRATSGIVAVTTRPGAERRTQQADLSVIDGGLLAQGTAGSRARYMFALRRSFIDLVMPAVGDAFGPVQIPRYWDEQARFDVRLSTKWKLIASTVGSDDALELWGDRSGMSPAHHISSRGRFLRATLAARYHAGPWQAKLALSGLAQESATDAGELIRYRSRKQTITPRAEVSRRSPAAIGLSQILWRAGTEAAIGRNTLDFSVVDDRREGEPPLPPDPDDPTTFDGAIWTPNFAAWTAVGANLDARVRVTLGLRADAFARVREVAIQPRGELSVRVSEPWLVRLSAGAYRRPPEFEAELIDRSLSSEHATQIVAGVQHDPNEHVRIQASTYYTDRRELIARDNMTGALANIGHGNTVGGELLATLRSDHWFALLGYSISRSTRVDGPGAAQRLFDYDQPHSLNVAASHKRGKWQLGARFQLYSGFPDTPVLGSVFESDRNAYVPEYGDVNSARHATHHQLDVRIDRTWKIGAMALTGFLDVRNVYFQRTVQSYTYNFDYSMRANVKSLPLLPSLGVRGVL